MNLEAYKSSHLRTVDHVLSDMERAGISTGSILSSSNRSEIYGTSNLEKLNHSGESIPSVSDLGTAWASKASLPVLVVRDLEAINSNWKEAMISIATKIAPELAWMYRKSAASFSIPKASLGYHADNYHVAILQLQGTRHWRVWGNQVLSQNEQQFLQRERRDDTDPLPTMPSKNPIIDITLNPGQILWIPALHPHLGQTNSNSNAISISFVWQPPSYLKLAYFVRQHATRPISTAILQQLIPQLYTHLHWFTNDNAITELRSAIKSVAVQLSVKFPDEIVDEIVRHFVREKFWIEDQA
jgi:ribosomal protein L16 Arg81 hydroxylase